MTTLCKTCEGEGRVKCGDCHGSGEVVDIRRIRKSAGISLRTFADRLGYSASYVCDVELGRRRLTSRLFHAYEALPRDPIDETLRAHGLDPENWKTK